MKNPPRNTSHITKTIALMLLTGGFLGSTAQSCQTTTNGPFWGAINELWNLPTEPVFIQDLAGSINPDGTLVLNQAAALIKRFPSGNIIADILSIDAALLPAIAIPGSSTTGAVPARQGFLDVDLAAANALILPAVAIPASTTTAFVPGRTGVLGTDIGLADALILGLAASGISPARTNIIGVDAGLADALLLPLNPVLASATTAAVPARLGVIGPDINQLKSYLGVGGNTTLGADMGIIDAKILNPATGNIIADINTVDARIATPATGVLSTSVLVVKTILGVGGATSLSADAIYIDDLILPPNIVPPSVPLQTFGSTANTDNIYADIATILNGPSGTTTLGIGVVGTTSLGEAIGRLDYILLGTAATGNLFNDIGNISVSLLPAAPIPANSLNTVAIPPQLSAAVPQTTGVIGDDLAILKSYLGVNGPITLGEAAGILDYSISGTLATNNLHADIATVDDQILPNVAIPASTTTSAVAAQTGVLGADLSIVDTYLLPLNPFGISPARTGVIGQDAGLIDGLLLPQFPILAGTLNVTAIPPQLSAAVASRSGVIGIDISTLNIALGVGGPITLGESIGIVDASLLPFPAITASGTTGSVPANQGILKTDVIAVDNLILPVAAITASTTTAAVAAQSGVLGRDLGITDAYLLPQFVTGIAPARTNNIGRDEGLVDALLLPLNPVGTVPARTGVIGTDINLLKIYLGVGGTTSLGVDMGIIDERIVINATGDLTADLATVTDLVGINGGDNLQADLRTLDERIVIAPTDNLSDDVATVAAIIGIGGSDLESDLITLAGKIVNITSGNLNTDVGTVATALGVPGIASLQSDVETIDNIIPVNTGNLYVDVTNYVASNASVLTTIDNRLLPLIAIPTGVGTYAVAANTGQGAATAAQVNTDISTVQMVGPNTTANLGVITGNGTLGESIGVLDYKIHAQTGTGSLFADIDAVKALIGVNGNSLFDDATAIDALVAGGSATGDLSTDLNSVRSQLGVFGASLRDDVTTIDLRILPASAIPPSAAIIPPATFGCQGGTGNVNNDITSILTGGPTKLGTVGVSSLGEGIGILDYRVLGTSATGNLNLDLLQVVNRLGVAVSPPAINTSVTTLINNIQAAVPVTHPLAFAELNTAVNWLITKYQALGGN